MRIPPSIYYTIGRFLLFIAIEAICIAMAANNGIVQQYKIVEAIREVESVFWEAGSNIKAYSQLKSINADLANHNTSLLEENIRLKRELAAVKGAQLADSLINSGLLADTSYKYDWAKVIKNSINTHHNYIVIDKGRKDGVCEDMGVITPNGVVGIIRAVGENHAFVFSFLNHKQQISAKLSNNTAFGPLAWDGDNIGYASLSEIPQHVAVAPGDTVYTSGYSSFFPADIPIGIAESSKIVNGMHRNVKVKLLQDFRLLDYVIVVKNNYFNEIESLSGQNIEKK